MISSLSRSDHIQAKIQRLQNQKQDALKREARARCMAIFGEVPRNYCHDIEEMFGMVARVYVKRAYRYKGDGHLDHEWIELWHKHDGRPVKELLEDAEAYVAGGCGFAG